MRTATLLLAVLGLGAGAAADAVPIGGTRQLFIDDAVVAEMHGVSRIFHQPRKHPGNPVLSGERPWEGKMVEVGTVLYDEEERIFKMWYGALEMHYEMPPRPFDQYDNLLRASKYREEFRPCYATSNDGIHWTRPELGLVEFQGSNKNNLLARGGFGSLFKDARERNPARRYKLAGYWPRDRNGNYGVGVWFSPDGLHWTPFEGNPVIRGTSDVHTLLGWDERIGKYVGYFRPGWSKDQADFERLSPPAGKLRARTIGYSTSEDFERWTPIVSALQPDAEDPVDTQFYGMPALKYEGHYLGFPWVFRTNEITHVPQLVWSRDGQHFKRTPGRCDFLPLGPAGAWDDGNAYVSRPFVHLDRIWFYYSGTRWRGMPDLFEMGDSARDAVGIATLPLDGFASIQAGPNPGTLTTRPILFAGRKLVVNFEESVKGYSGIDERTELRIELVGDDGAPPARLRGPGCRRRGALRRAAAGDLERQGRCR